MSIGDVWSEAWRYYTSHWGRFVGLAAVVFIVLDLLTAIAAALRSDHWVIWGVWSVASIFVWLVGSYWVQGAIVEGVNDARQGRRSTAAENFERVRPQLGSLILASVLAGLGVAIGLLLLIVPGLILLTLWSLLVPAIQLEKLSTGAGFSRSAELVRGHGFQVFGILLVTYIVVAVAVAILNGIFAIFLSGFFESWLGGLIANSLVIPFASIVHAVIYFRLAGVERAEPTGSAPAAA
jgi:hypothetical protein